MRDGVVALRGVTKDYPLGKQVVHALRGIDLSIAQGEFTAIAGPSGSGKTTLLNLIGCVDTPSQGSVRVDGHAVESLSDSQRTTLRLQTLGFIFQSFNLIQVLDVFQNVEFPLLLQRNHTATERKNRVKEIIDAVGLSPQIRQRPNELSGGQRQRVAVARALVTQPKIVMADEPTANLDSATGQTIIDLMRDLNAREKTTFIFSTHDPQVMENASRVIHLHDGIIPEKQPGANH
ncbi:MAG: ABC transporter ATP-binding protein [Myxococcota bacterium]|nr:ABC transporter ATP-binding protein [Myxococcota bacterium]